MHLQPQRPTFCGCSTLLRIIVGTSLLMRSQQVGITRTLGCTQPLHKLFKRACTGRMYRRGVDHLMRLHSAAILACYAALCSRNW